MENRKYLCLILPNNTSSFHLLCIFVEQAYTDNVLQSVKLPHGVAEKVKNILWMWSSILNVCLL